MRILPKIKEPIWLNLGCGEHEMKKEGFVGVDVRDCGQTVIWDVRDGLPFPDESVEKIYSCHFIEHMDDDESIALFKEMLRVLKKKGTTEHRLPHVTHATAFYTGHKTFWNEARVGALIRSPGLERFEIIRNEHIGAELFFALKKRLL